MIRDVVTVRQGRSVEEAARIMMTAGVTHLPVIDEDDRLVGIVYCLGYLKGRSPEVHPPG